MAQKEPEILFIMLGPGLTNGIILPGFANAEVFPGEPIQVRGENGMNYEHALTLVNNNKFVWCNHEGTPLLETPEPTEAEAAIIKRAGTDVLPDIPGAYYPDYHRVDRDYKPVSVQRAERLAAAQANLPAGVVAGAATVELLAGTPQEPPQPLAMIRTSGARRGAMGSPEPGIGTPSAPDAAGMVSLTDGEGGVPSATVPAGRRSTAERTSLSHRGRTGEPAGSTSEETGDAAEES